MFARVAEILLDVVAILTGQPHGPGHGERALRRDRKRKAGPDGFGPGFR